MKDWYTWMMVGLLGWIGYVHFTGGGPNDGLKEKVRPGPHSVRNNPGSHRSHYRSHYVHIGGK